MPTSLPLSQVLALCLLGLITSNDRGLFKTKKIKVSGFVFATLGN